MASKVIVFGSSGGIASAPGRIFHTRGCEINHHRWFLPKMPTAAIRFSGYFQQDVINKKKQSLSQWLEEEGLETEGDFIVAGYNPPWVPGFLARNEVMIKSQRV